MERVTLESDDKKIFGLSFIFGAIVTTILIVISIFDLISYKVAVSFLIGLLTGNALHYLTISVINRSKVESYVMVVRLLGVLKKILYVATLIAIYFITRSIWAFIACVVGITIIKLAIVIIAIKRKKNG